MNPNERQSWIERAIQEAQERGLFENLEGKGRPIDWEDESLVDEAWVMAFRIMREQGFAPQWIELHKEISAELEQARKAVLRGWRWREERLPGARGSERRRLDAEWARARSAFAETLAELNQQIADFNLQVPIPNLQKLKLKLARELEALGIEE